MADLDVIQKALDALVLMNTAIKNVRLYPPTSASIISTIDKLHYAFQEMFQTREEITFAESEKTVLICGEPLNQKDQERTHVKALLQLLLNYGLKSLSFRKGLEKTEA